MEASDKKLLELAAKAAGYMVKAWSETGRGAKIHGQLDWWNPLINDGDALRLAVNLRIFIDVGDLEVICGWYIDSNLLVLKTVEEPLQQDSQAAVRLAIVRAAAEIGKQKD